MRGAGHEISPTPTLIVVTLLIFLALGIWLKVPRRNISDQVLVELRGFVSDTGIVLDYAFSAREFPWSQFVITYEDDQRIVGELRVLRPVQGQRPGWPEATFTKRGVAAIADQTLRLFSAVNHGANDSECAGVQQLHDDTGL